MMIPGANILNMAMSVIQKQAFVYHRFRARETNEIGLDVTTYFAPVSAVGSVQPVARTLYHYMGLDLQKDYFNFFLSKGIIDIDRDVSGDQFTFNNKRFQCLSKTDWHAIDGWDQVLCVRVPNDGACC